MIKRQALSATVRDASEIFPKINQIRNLIESPDQVLPKMSLKMLLRLSLTTLVSSKSRICAENRIINITKSWKATLSSVDEIQLPSSTCSDDSVLKYSPPCHMASPKTGYSAREIERNVVNMLQYLKEQRSYPNFGDLTHATYACNLTRRYEDFVDVINEWFRQTRPLFDEMSYFKCTSDLCNLGKLNKVTDGRLIQQMGWKPVRYFLRRMMDIGFHRFHAEDVISALTGIHDLITNSVKDASPGGKPVSAAIADIFHKWLTEFERYLWEKRSDDADWKKLVRDTAPLSLFFVKEINLADPSSPTPSRHLFEILIRLSKFGFDDMLAYENRRRVEKKDQTVDGKGMRVSTIMMFAQVFTHFDVDPEQFAPGIWSTWFQLYLMAKKYEEHPFVALGYPPQFCSKFPSFSPIFWPRFDDWNVEAESRVQAYLNDPERRRTDSSSGFSNFIFNVGNFARICRYDADFVARRHQLRALLRLFQHGIAPVNWDELPAIRRSRTLTGFREFRRSLEPDPRAQSRE